MLSLPLLESFTTINRYFDLLKSENFKRFSWGLPEQTHWLWWGTYRNTWRVLNYHIIIEHDVILSTMTTSFESHHPTVSGSPNSLFIVLRYISVPLMISLVGLSELMLTIEFGKLLKQHVLFIFVFQSSIIVNIHSITCFNFCCKSIPGENLYIQDLICWYLPHNAAFPQHCSTSSQSLLTLEYLRSGYTMQSLTCLKINTFT